ncbi:hypothetical protein GCM10010493_57340 [Streptomyces lavendulae subsp. grasserius]
MPFAALAADAAGSARAVQGARAATSRKAGPIRPGRLRRSKVQPCRRFSLALLSVDLDAVARRLRLTLEASWDGHGTVRAAFFVLNGTDFVVVHHEGELRPEP